MTLGGGRLAERVETVRLMANVSNYIAGMETAQLRTQRLAATSTARLAAQRAAFMELGTAALAVGAIAAVGVALAISKFNEFDQAMSQVQAVTQETAANQKLLWEAALAAGGATVYTATEAAGAIEELGKAGLDTSDILGGALSGSLDLAAAGNIEVARSAEIVSTTLKQFNLDGSESARVVDVLAAAAGKSLAGVDDLALALEYAGPVAAGMSVSVEDTAAALALFADQGLRGEKAGTGLRGMLVALTSPSAQAQKEMDRLGISLYDANGNFLGLENVAGELRGELAGLTDAERDLSLGIIFGNMQVTAARVLVREGAEGFREYRAAVEDSGYAAKVANDRLDNLRGDLEKLGGAFDTVLIRQGSAANDTLRALAQSATFLVEMSGDLPPVAVNIGLVAAALALAGGTALVGVGKFASFKNSLTTLGISAGTAAVRVGLVSAALTVVTFLIGAFVQAQAESKARQDEFRDSLDQTTGALTDYSRELIATQLQASGLFDEDLDPGPAVQGLEELGITQQELTDALYEGGAAYDTLLDKIDQYGKDGGPRAQLAADRVRNSLERVNGELQGGRQDWEELQAAQLSGAAAAEENADALAVLEGQASDTAGVIDDLSNQILNFGKATLDTREAERQFQAAIDDLTESVAENGQTLDVNTDAGRANEAALDDLAEAALKRASAIVTMTGDDNAARQAIESGREALINQLAAFGITGQAAEDYADMLGLIPGNINTALTINTGAAFAALAELQRRLAGNKAALDSLNNWRPSNFSYGPSSANGNMFSYANGGFGEGMYSGGRPLYKFAEPETGWEAFISGRPGAEARNRSIWAEAGMRLGMGGGQGGGVTTAYVDPAFLRAIERLASAHKATLDTVGLADAVAAGSARSNAMGAR